MPRRFKIFALVGLIYSVTAGSLAPAAVPQPSVNVPACVFDNVLAFGASVTHGSAAIMPGYEYLIQGIETYGAYRGTYARGGDVPATARPYGLSPVRYLVKHYAGTAGLDRVTYISSFRTKGPNYLGSSRARSMLFGKRRPLFDAASLIVGVDAFYWDAIENTCGPQLDKTITDLISTARDAKKVLILGTVPTEDPLRTRIDSNRTGVRLWTPPNVACAARINSILRTTCTAENRCYIADLEDTVARLLKDEKLPLKSDGQSYGLYAMRPDGVHLSDKGSRYLSELIVTALEARPLTCR